jgi:2-polyprenyl-3-methyl-5-hydroxy-6-metoxy-1,4-benzoquinol methylase
LQFSKRSYEKEILDSDDIPFDDIRQNMRELDFINTWLGGHGITTEGFKKLLASPSLTPLHAGPIVVCEIGCGGGDNLRVLKRYCQKHQIDAAFIGVDINPHCIDFAASRPENAGIDFICSDYRTVHFDHPPDIIFCSLFLHHFTDEEIISIFQWMKDKAAVGFFVNDLDRHPFAYYSIKWLTALFSKSYLVKNDACLSVLRGFRRGELRAWLSGISGSSVSIEWKWAFRWLITCAHA